MDEAWCSKCQAHYPVSDFARDKTRASGYSYNCKRCIREYREQRRATEARRAKATLKHIENLETYIEDLVQILKDNDLEPPEAPWSL